jgi:hypothetical protein
MNGDCDLLADMADVLRRHGLASDLIARLVAELRHRYGGTTCYIPQRDPQRRAAIAADPDPPKVVAQKHAVSVRTVYRARRDEWGL